MKKPQLYDAHVWAWAHWRVEQVHARATAKAIASVYPFTKNVR